MAEKVKSNITGIVGGTVGVLLLLIVLLPFSLYIPWVQNIAKDYACEWASEETGLDISIDRVLIKFPLDVSVDGLLVLDEQRDTMLSASNFTAGVAVLPLFRLNVEVDEASLADARYRMVSEDSSMVFKAHVEQCLVKGIGVDLDHNAVNLADGTVKGGNVNLDYYPHKVVIECDTAESSPWKIQAYHLKLEDVDYAMTMLPTIDTLKVHLQTAELADGLVDTGSRKVDARCLSIDTIAVRYIYPSERFAREYALAHPVPADTLCNPADTVPWTIKADSLRLAGGDLAYAQRDARLFAGRGLDMRYIDVAGLNVAIDSLYNRGSDVNFALRRLDLTENGSGLAVTRGEASVAINSQLISVEKAKLSTLLSDINLDAHIDLSISDNPNKGYIHVATDSRIALQDVSKLMPEYAPVLKGIPQYSPLALKGELSGNASRVDVMTLTADLPKYAHATVSGTVYNPTSFNAMSGDVKLDARFDNINFVKPTLLDKSMQNEVNFPPMSLTANAKLDHGRIAADAVMTLSTGKLVGTGSFNTNTDEYDLDASFNGFPVRAILPLYDIDNLTADMRFRGKGFDFLSPSTHVNAEIDLASVVCNKYLYENLDARMAMADGVMTGRITSANDNCRVDVDVEGSINGRHYQIDARGNIADLDLNALGFYKGECSGRGRLVGTCDIDLDLKEYNVDVDVEDLDWVLDGDILRAAKASATFNSNATSTHATFENEDNHVAFDAPHGIDSLIHYFSKSADIAMHQYKHLSINIDTLQEALPTFNLGLKMGMDGLVQRYVQKYGVDFRRVGLDMRNDSTIFIDGYVHSLSLEGTNIDTLTLKATQWNKYLAFKAHMGNRPGTWDEFAQVSVMGGVKGSTLDFLLTQQNIHNETGYRVGCNATLTDTAVNMKMFPREPIIGYRNWVMNEGNYINFNYGTKMLDADLKLESDSSVVALKTQRVPGATTEDILLNIANLRIEEWTRFLPNLAPMSGVLNANMDVAWNGHNVEGKGMVNLNNFVYNGMKEGDLTVNTTYGLDPETGGTHIDADMVVDGAHVAMALGSFSDATQGNSMSMALKLNRFPLSKASPFIPGRMLRLRGYLNGEVNVSGTMDNPIINGNMVGDSAYVVMPRYGCSLRLSDDKLSVVDNKMELNNYRIISMNNNPVNVNGIVDFRDMDNMIIDLTLKGKNIQVIGAEQRTFSEVFGKAFADIDASITSRNNYMNMRADLTVLSGSNITYVLQDEINSLGTTYDENMVTFVNLNDSTGGTPNLVTAKGSYATNILANIVIQQGTKINAFLSPDGKDRASIDGSARLKYSLDFAGKDVLTGTYTIESGQVRYTPPLISQKNFTIASGSTVVWNGDMLNPQLNISGTEHVKTSVSQGDGSSRLVDFLITANVGGTLGVIKLDFDMSTESDMGVMNELQSMSDVQRSQAAINMLLYNTYAGTNSAGNVNGLTASAALFSFLQSQLNSWAAKTLKGVDLSFGINQYEGRTGKGTETSYSYRLSKNLFNDRFKIVVGGEYSTDATAEENFGQNLISDISFEYSLNETGNKYVRLFRHTGFESILEGQIVETGVGFVMKRKVSSLKSLFGVKPMRVTIMDTIPAARKEEENVEVVTDSTTTAQ